MDLSKMGEFSPTVIGDNRIHIIGCGSVGSTLAENLARFGYKNFNLWDDDVVEPKNIVNQMFTEEDIGKPKTEVTAQIIKKINPEADIRIRQRYTDEQISGYIFLCVDSIVPRKTLVEKLRPSNTVKAVFDFRTGLYEAQHYAADWNNPADIDKLYKSMNFTDEEAKLETPHSACGVSLCVAPTVRLIAAWGAMNFYNFLRGKPLKKFVLVNSENFDITAV